MAPSWCPASPSCVPGVGAALLSRASSRSICTGIGRAWFQAQWGLIRCAWVALGFWHSFREANFTYTLQLLLFSMELWGVRCFYPRSHALLDNNAGVAPYNFTLPILDGLFCLYICRVTLLFSYTSDPGRLAKFLVSSTWATGARRRLRCEVQGRCKGEPGTTDWAGGH